MSEQKCPGCEACMFEGDGSCAPPPADHRDLLELVNTFDRFECDADTDIAIEKGFTPSATIYRAYRNGSEVGRGFPTALVAWRELGSKEKG